MTLAVSYIGHLGDDLMVSNAARVSFGRRHGEFVYGDHMGADERLLKSLARDGHWAPFAHPTICLHIKAPVFVRTQCFKSKIGFVENEISRRYVDGEPEMYVPPLWREKSKRRKQGSAGELENQHDADAAYQRGLVAAVGAYYELLELNVAPEQARMVLPQAMITEWWWTGSLAAWARFYFLRSAPDAQSETRDVAALAEDILKPLFPVSWAALTEGIQ